MALFKSSVSGEQVSLPRNLSINDVYLRIQEILIKRSDEVHHVDVTTNTDDGDTIVEQVQETRTTWVYKVVACAYPNTSTKKVQDYFSKLAFYMTEEEIYAYDGENIRERAYNALKDREDFFADAQDV